MNNKNYQSMKDPNLFNRRDFLKIGGLATAVVGSGLILGNPTAWANNKISSVQDKKPKTNIDDIMKIPRVENSLPGKFPGKVVEVFDNKAVVDDKFDKKVISKMFIKGLTKLTGKNQKESFKMLFTKDDIVGIKVNPVGPNLISTRIETVQAIIDWLASNGMKKNNIIIWDRFDYMLKDAGYTKENFPGVQIMGLQTMDEAAAEGKSQDDSKWLDKDGKHISEGNFDKDVFYFADVDAPKDKPYLNQHVFNEKNSYFGKLLTKTLTKIINVPAFKNTGNGISMATKSIGYGAICNTGRLHKPLFFDVCTEVFAFPAVRDKLVLNVTDALKAQYDGGPDANAKFIYTNNTLFFATDPFALDYTCHHILVKKRKEMQVKVNEHPIYTDYFKYAQKLGLGITDPEKIQHIKA
jgi:hypothetical protein